MRINVLHISDVHFGCADKVGEQERIVAGIAEAIADDHGQIDLIVFSGDLSQQGRPDELQMGQDWISSLGERFRCPLIVVPGNHDVDRTRANKGDLRLAYSGLEQFDLKKSDIYQRHEHLKGFLEWFRRAKIDDSNYANNWGANPFIDEIQIEVRGTSVSAICLNTAALSCGDDDIKKLCVDLGALNKALARASRRGDFVLVVGHHPTSDLAEWNGREVERILGQETGAHLYLHGHLHEEQVRSAFRNTGTGSCISASGAAYPGTNWPKVFAILGIDFGSKELVPTVFQLSDASGKWHRDESQSRPIPIRLPRLVSPSLPNAKDSGGSPSSQLQRIDNPFSQVMANGMPPIAVHRLFVDQNNSLSCLSNRGDSIVEGQRGTGKTMLLRYFSLDVQCSLEQTKATNEVVRGLNDRRTPLGIYCCLSNAGLNRSDFGALESKDRSLALFEHRLVLFLVGKLFESIGNVLDLSKSNLSRTRTLIKRTLRLENLAERADGRVLSIAVVDECNIRIQEIDEHTASILPGGKPTAFNPWLTLSTTFLQILAACKSDIGAEPPFFFLVDDFDGLSADQQTVVFRTAAVRNHALVCWKFGVMSSGQKSFMSGNERTYREGDDYNLLELNWVDRGPDREGGEGSYKRTVEEICKKRMNEARWPADLAFADLFSTWEHGNKIRDQVKRNTQAEYEKIPKSKRPETFKSLWDKQGDALYFRHLRSKKIEHRYAGPAAIIELSSGIFRQFLEICSDVVDQALGSGWRPEGTKKIGPVSQNQAIRKWSRDMLRSLGNSGDISTLSRRNFNVTSRHIVNIAQGLSSYFAARLYSESKDPEVLAIAIRGEFHDDSFARALIDVAVRESVLQRRSVDYPAKSGGAVRLPTYSLNRRLVPMVSIGYKLQGRHEITAEDVELLATDPESFVAKMLKSINDRDVKQKPLL